MQNLLQQYDIRQLGNLELLAKQVVEGFLIGLHKSPFHGFSVEFAEHRQYNPGDPLKNVDWRVFGRTERMYTKRYEEETNLRCQFVIDCSSSMHFPYAPKGEPMFNKLAFSLVATAALINLLQKQRDAFGLSLFDDKIIQHTTARNSNSHYKLLMTYLTELALKPELNHSTSAAKAINEISESIHRRSMVVIFSDMFEQSDDTEALFSALQHLKHNKHEVIMFHVVEHNKEIDFNFENRPYQFIDMETGEKLKLQPNEIKEAYKKQMTSFTESLKMRCLQYKIDFVEADINQGFQQILSPYLHKRSRMG